MLPKERYQSRLLAAADRFFEGGIYRVLLGFVAPDFLRLLDQPVINCKIGWHGSHSHTSLHNLMCK